MSTPSHTPTELTTYFKDQVPFTCDAEIRLNAGPPIYVMGAHPAEVQALRDTWLVFLQKNPHDCSQTMEINMVDSGGVVTLVLANIIAISAFKKIDSQLWRQTVALENIASVVREAWDHAKKEIQEERDAR